VVRSGEQLSVDYQRGGCLTLLHCNTNAGLIVAGESYTGIKRRKQTPWSVRFGDALASRVIAVGGIGTIAAILLVVLVLLGTALPLLQRPKFSQWHTLSTPSYRHAGIDEDGLILWGMDVDGRVEARSSSTGELLASFPMTPGENAPDQDSQAASNDEQTAQPPGGTEPDDSAGDEQLSPDTPRLTSSNVTIDRSMLVAGFSDGTIRTANIEFETSLLAVKELPAGVSVDQRQPVATDGEEVYLWLDATGARRVRLSEVVWSDAKQLGEGPVKAIDFVPDRSANRLSRSTRSQALAVVGDSLVFAKIVGKRGFSGSVTETVELTSCPIRQRDESYTPIAAMLVNDSDHAVVVWGNGTIERFSLGGERPEPVEVTSAVVGNMRVSCAAPLLARQTVLVGLDDGRLQGWMVTRKQSAGDGDTKDEASSDNYRMTLAHEVDVSPGVSLVTVTSSQQNHVAVTANAAGEAALIYVTTDSLLSRESLPLEDAPTSVSLDPSGDTLVAASQRQVGLVGFDIGYPEASWKSYFGRVWYEGYHEPRYVWQSSAGTEQSEIKISLVPLVFGTLKATVYAMLISVPLAIMAAIYTSEFLRPSTRGRIKPVIELMASLPSVVLGYIAAMVMAPFLQEHLMAVLAGLVVVPMTFVVAGNLWNLLPVDLLVRLQPWRLLAMFICLPIALWISRWVGGIAEASLFDGSLVRWLGTDDGSPLGGWMLLSIPLLMLLVTLLFFGPLADWTRRLAIARTPRGFSLFALGRLAAVTCLVLLTAWGLSASLATVGWDVRGNLFDSYQDRNALLVGGALGFCVIPMIYTLSDDALQAVPGQLRSASLGCGATPWQTTMRVVVPSAMSGLFSAVMIGLGRAVGETMVVLMAAGNTPVMEWNPFNGFRTLSATLATELPEAAKGSTHFRTLFLAALLLFVLTLIANTLAEFVRIRFRKRASQL
jgi:phosphate transport system permease protein